MKHSTRLRLSTAADVAFWGTSAMAMSYTITDLGLPFAGQAVAINNYGLVISRLASDLNT